MPIDYDRKGNIGYFTIRSGSVNPISPDMHRELFYKIRDFVADDEIHVGILQGAGDRAFSAGDDLKSPKLNFKDPEDHLSHALSSAHLRDDVGDHKWFDEVIAIKRYKPIIGAVRGYCVGAGLAYLLQLTDIRVAAEDAKFGFPEIAYGMGGAGGVTRLMRYIPPALAMEILLTGDPIDAATARAAYLVNAVVPAPDVLKVAEEYAQRIARHPPLGVRIEMETAIAAFDLKHQEAVDFSNAMMNLRRIAFTHNAEIGEFLYKRDDGKRTT